MKASRTVTLTVVEAEHLETLLADAVERGDYYGNKAEYWKRHGRIIAKLVMAKTDRPHSLNEATRRALDNMP